MRNWITRWIAAALALFIITKLPFGVTLKNDNVGALLLAVVAIGFANVFIRPIIMFFAWPINCLTFGLLGFVINVLLFQLVGNVIKDFHVANFGSALIGSVLMGIISGAINFLLKDRGDRDAERD